MCHFDPEKKLDSEQVTQVLDYAKVLLLSPLEP